MRNRETDRQRETERAKGYNTKEEQTSLPSPDYFTPTKPASSIQKDRKKQRKHTDGESAREVVREREKGKRERKREGKEREKERRERRERELQNK